MEYIENSVVAEGVLGNGDLGQTQNSIKVQYGNIYENYMEFCPMPTDFENFTLPLGQAVLPWSDSNTRLVYNGTGILIECYGNECQSIPGLTVVYVNSYVPLPLTQTPIITYSTIGSHVNDEGNWCYLETIKAMPPSASLDHDAIIGGVIGGVLGEAALIGFIWYGKKHNWCSKAAGGDLTTPLQEVKETV